MHLKVAKMKKHDLKVPKMEKYCLKCRKNDQFMQIYIIIPKICKNMLQQIRAHFYSDIDDS